MDPIHTPFPNIVTVRDPSLGIETIRDDDLRLLEKEVTLEQYKLNPFPEEEYLIKKVITKLKGNWIHPSSVYKLHITYPADATWRTNLSYNVPKPIDEIELYEIPSTADGLIRMFRTMVINEQNKKMQLTIKPELVGVWLSLFCIYDKFFCANYDEYLTSPDTAMKLVERNESLYTACTTRPTEKAFSSIDIRATCHMILITINKGFAAGLADRDRQLNEYIMRRKSAAYSSMGMIAGELKIHDRFFLDLHLVFRTLPRLRRMLFFYMYTHRIENPEFSTAAVLLYHSAMTTIQCIQNFIDLEKKTKAHVEPKVLEEIKLYTETVRRKRDVDGALWPYHRVLYPEDGDLNAANFPNIAVASVHYFKEFGEPSFQYMVPPNFPTIPGLLKKIKEPEERDIFERERERIMTADAIAGARIIGLDLAKLEGTRRVQREAGVDGERAEMLAQLANLLRQ